MPTSSPADSLPRNLAGLDLAALLAGGAGPGDPGEVPSPAELSALLPAYAVESLLGRGGMGAVYRARQRTLDRTVALKVLPPEIGTDAALAERFRREAQVLARLQHPHIVAVHEFGISSGGHLFFAMDLVEGGDLSARLRAGAVAPAEALRWLREICGALEYAHAQGVIHRDIKPSNILLTPEGQVKVADFGLAVFERRGDTPKLTHTGVAVGTMEYAAPEQLSGDADRADARSDVYSLGVLSYELLTGELPRGVFDPPSVRSPGKVDAVYDDVILRAMASDPARRYPGAAAFHAALDRPVRDAAKLRRRNTLIAAFALLAMLAAGGAWLAVSSSREAGRQAALADAAREEAEQLVDFMVNDLQAKLRDIQQLSFLGSVVARVDAYYQSAPERLDDAAFLGRKAQFYEVRGIVQRVRGGIPAAAESFARALSLLDRLCRLEPDRIKWRRQQYGVIWQQESGGTVLPARLEAAEAVVQEMERRWPRDSATLQSRMDLCQRRSARLGSDGNLPAAIAELDRSDAILRSLMESNDGKFTGIDAWGLNRLSRSHLLNKAGDTEAAIIAARQALDFFSARMEKEPHSAHWEGRVAYTSHYYAWSLAQAGRHAEAIPHSRRAVELTEKLASRSPDNLESQHDCRKQLELLASLCETLDCKDEALAAREKLADIPGALAARAARGDNSATAAQSIDEPARRKAVEDLFAAMESPGGAAAAHDAWVRASENYGQWLQLQQREADALAHYTAWQKRLQEKAAAAEPGSVWHSALAYTLNRIGAIHEARGDWNAALPPYQAALQARLTLITRDPATERCHRDLASSFGHVLDGYFAGKRASDALRLSVDITAALTPHTAHLKPGGSWARIYASGVDKALDLSADDPALAGTTSELKQKAAAFLESLAPGGKGLTGEPAASLHRWRQP